MFWSISEANVATVVRLFKTLFCKIHDIYHNFLNLVCKAEHMFFSTKLILFQSIACSRCPSADFIAPVPVTMSQFGHVFLGFFVKHR